MSNDSKKNNDIPKGTIISNISRTVSGNPDNSTFDPNDMPVLPTRNLMLFPGVSTPITIGRKSSFKIARTAADKHIIVGVFCQKDADVENPELSDLYPVGAAAEIIDVIKLPDGNHVAIANALYKVELTGHGKGETIPDCISAAVAKCKDSECSLSQRQVDFLIDEITKIALSLVEEQSPERFPEFKFSFLNLKETYIKVSYLCTNLPLSPQERFNLMNCSSLGERLQLLYQIMLQYGELIQLSERIKESAREQMSNQQKQVYLTNQMDAIKSELYGDDDDADVLLAKAEQKNLPQYVMDHFEKEIRKLERLNPQSPDYAVLQTYLDTLVSIPWGKSEAEYRTISQAERILNRDHFGLEKVKERILEQLAMILYNPEGRAPIICLVGPPGVGKTSLGESIASALGREFQRISLGGLHDEAEIRGHRRTYIGAMPGRIIDAMKKCEKTNPVLLLDEIDKIGKDYKGDPAAALLEVLDPEQNKTFHDNYIDVDYSLSDVLFICTANTTSTIPNPLLDRMELIEIPGYLLEEKIEIAKRHLIPRALSRANMKGLKFKKDAILKIIEGYTSESGVRQLDKEISSIIRKYLLKCMRKDEYAETYSVSAKDVTEFLGTEKVIKDRYVRDLPAGVVPGLAWTSVGGEMLYIEALLVPGKGDRVNLTGNLGDVMKESATIAWQIIRANAEKFGINQEIFSKYDIHIHAPEGAVPKDGPSAGITIATAITSACLGKSIKPGIAMTGEITLTGKVLPVGGIREKILAAKRVGINTIILSSDNERHIKDIPEEYRKGMNFIFVEKFTDVLKNVF